MVVGVVAVWCGCVCGWLLWCVSGLLCYFGWVVWVAFVLCVGVRVCVVCLCVIISCRVSVSVAFAVTPRHCAQRRLAISRLF